MTTVRAVKVTTTGDFATIDMVRDSDTAYEPKGSLLTSLREAIGCAYVEMVQCGALTGGNRLDMWLDEEGGPLCRSDAQVNAAANLFLSQADIQTNGYIHGTVVFTESTADGETVGLSDKTHTLVTQTLYTLQEQAREYHTRRYGGNQNE